MISTFSHSSNICCFNAGFSFSKNVSKDFPMYKYIVPIKVIAAVLIPGFVALTAFLTFSINDFVLTLIMI